MWYAMSIKNFFSCTLKVQQLKINVLRNWARHKSITSNETENYIPRRAILYVPGSDEKKIKKIASLEVDCAVLDCEDGVAYNKKVEARQNIVKFLPELLAMKKRTELVVRVNSVGSGLLSEDLGAVLHGKILPKTLMLPKVDSKENIKTFANLLKENLKTRDVQPKIKLITFVESAVGLINLRSVLELATQDCYKKSFELVGVVFGSDDFCADIGASRSLSAGELLYARQKIVTYAKAFKLQAIDLVYIDFNDLNGLKAHSVEGANFGFTGKQVIHPGQIPIVQEAFSPSVTQVKWAEDLMKAFQSHQEEGKGAFTFQGKMIDMPLLLQAKNILQMAHRLKGS